MSLSVIWPALFVGLAWWGGTALVLSLNHRPPATFRRSLTFAVALAFLVLASLPLVSSSRSVLACYAAFAMALVLWGVVEMSLLMGFITGPRRQPSSGETGWRRFTTALSTLLFHELALLAVGGCLFVATLGAPNRVALWTYCILWGMRTSAKLNLFLGVRNFSEEFLPRSLRYLASYFRRAPMNPLFPVSVTLGTALAVLLLRTGLDVSASAFHRVSGLLLGGITALAVLEHWGLVLPVPLDGLWRSHRRGAGIGKRQANLVLVSSASPEAGLRTGRRPG